MKWKLLKAMRQRGSERAKKSRNQKGELRKKGGSRSDASEGAQVIATPVTPTPSPNVQTSSERQFCQSTQMIEYDRMSRVLLKGEPQPPCGIGPIKNNCFFAQKRSGENAKLSTEEDRN
jgi:hypothetical protein